MTSDWSVLPAPSPASLFTVATMAPSATGVPATPAPAAGAQLSVAASGLTTTVLIALARDVLPCASATVAAKLSVAFAALLVFRVSVASDHDLISTVFLLAVAVNLCPAASAKIAPAGMAPTMSDFSVLPVPSAASLLTDTATVPSAMATPSIPLALPATSSVGAKGLTVTCTGAGSPVLVFATRVKFAAETGVMLRLDKAQPVTSTLVNPAMAVKTCPIPSASVAPAGMRVIVSVVHFPNGVPSAMTEPSVPVTLLVDQATLDVILAKGVISD